MTLDRQFFLLFVALAIAVGACAACQPTDRDQGRRTVEPETVLPPTAEPSPTPGSPTHTPGPLAPEQPIKATPMPPSSKDPIDLARADLAQRLDIEISQITVVHVQADEFPASNLGCPGKAVQPMPALVSGIEIVLSVAEQEHVYRARRHHIVYCGPRP